MKHIYLDPNSSNPEHYAVSKDGGKVLVQIGDQHDQARISLTPDQAGDLAGRILINMMLAEEGTSIPKIVKPRRRRTNLDHLTPEEKKKHHDEVLRQWRRDNAEDLAQYKRQWHKDHPEKTRDYCRAWAAKHPDLVGKWRREAVADTRMQASQHHQVWTASDLQYVRDHWKTPLMEVAKALGRTYNAVTNARKAIKRGLIKERAF